MAKLLFDTDFLKKLELLYIISKKLFRGKLKGERRTREKGTSVEFADYRDYVPGDDLRYIDWNIFRRLDKLLLKLYEEEEDYYIYLLVDESRSMSFGEPSKLHFAKQVAAALAYIGLANHDRVAIATFTDRLTRVLPPVHGKGQILKVFRFLEQEPEREATGLTAIGDACVELLHRTKRRGIAVLLSDFLDPAGCEQGLKHFIYHRFDIYALHIVAPVDEDPRLSGDINIVDSETGEVREVLANAETLARYRDEWKAFCGEIDAFCRGRDITYIRTTTGSLFDDLVRKIFRTGGFLK